MSAGMIKSIEWKGDHLRIIDQTKIPEKLTYLELFTVEEVYESIRRLEVRGAPAIGVAAAYGLYLGMRGRSSKNRNDFLMQTASVADRLSGARPTAINLRWALNSILTRIRELNLNPDELLGEVLHLARDIHQDDIDRCEQIGRFGASLIKSGDTILTHCNTGALATAGIGTALGAVYTAFQQSKEIQVLVDETRPLLQGARLTMWELEQAGIPATLITDNMAAFAMQKGTVDLVLVGADRIAANGDVANKIGTFHLAIAAHYHDIPFYVAAPLSSFDLSLSEGSQIPIEERSEKEVAVIWDQLNITTLNAKCWNPAFDVTPSELVAGIITEKGIIYPPYKESFENLQLNIKIYSKQEELNL
ncbi:MAG: S-methyl-5-thioribose-1-phosphate isomerase [Calditrichia bacterium]